MNDYEEGIEALKKKAGLLPKTMTTEAKTAKGSTLTGANLANYNDAMDAGKLGHYKEPGENATIFLGDHSPRESPWERSARWEEERYNAQRNAQIARAKERGTFNYRTGQLLNNAVWVGSPQDGHVESTLPKKIPAPEEVYDRLVAAETKIAELESRRNNQSREDIDIER